MCKANRVRVRERHHVRLSEQKLLKLDRSLEERSGTTWVYRRGKAVWRCSEEPVRLLCVLLLCVLLLSTIISKSPTQSARRRTPSSILRYLIYSLYPVLGSPSSLSCSPLSCRPLSSSRSVWIARQLEIYTIISSIFFALHVRFSAIWQIPSYLLNTGTCIDESAANISKIGICYYSVLLAARRRLRRFDLISPSFQLVRHPVIFNFAVSGQHRVDSTSLPVHKLSLDFSFNLSKPRSYVQQTYRSSRTENLSIPFLPRP